MHRLLFVSVLYVLVSLLAGSGVASSQRAGKGPVEAIRRENARPGTPAWKLEQAPGRSIEGYASEVSVVPGQRLHLHVSTTPRAAYRVEVYRLGWYRGAGGRLVACLPGCGSARVGASFAVPPPDPSTGLVRAGWPVTDVVSTGNWVSGYYLAELVLASGKYAGRGGWVPFIVRAAPARPSAMLVVASVNTWQAYNSWGGRSLYWNHTGMGDNHVSFDRPYDPAGLPTAGGPARPTAPVPQTWELPLVHFLEREGYDVSYTTDVDVDRDPSELARHRLVLTAGHSEYWTKAMRDGFERARDQGTNLAFMGANTGYWQVRYADDRRTIVEYRNATADPEPDVLTKTVRFRDLVPPRPECELLGVQFGEIGFADYAPAPGALRDPWFAGTGFTASSVLPGLVGGEYDSITDSCNTPALTDLFHYAGHNHANADAVRYTAPSGARVFSTGSLLFSWGLDPTTGRGDPRLQRFMRNAFTDLTHTNPHPSRTHG